MIRKFISIKNVGKFENYSASGQEFSKFNIIYGENGSGKTTLVSLLRSLKNKLNDIIIGRKTIDATSDQQILVLTDKGQIKFNNSGWDNDYKDIEVFDSNFISENVHAGYYVDVNHKRNLQLFAIGEAGVLLSKEIDELDNSSRELNKPISDKREKIENAFTDIYYDDIIKLPKIDNIESKISEQERLIKSLSSEKEIKEKESLAELIIPKFDLTELKEILSKSIKDVSSEAVKAVNEHLKNNLNDSNGENWIQEGLSYHKNDICPFCSQSTKDVDLISYYGKFFSEKYITHQNDVKDRIEYILNSLDKINFEILKTLSEKNVLIISFWKDHYKDDMLLPVLNIDKYNYEEFKENIKSLLDNKLLHLNESIPIDNSILAKIIEHQKYENSFEEYNKKVKIINNGISKLKISLGGKNIELEKTNLIRLKNVEIRFKPENIKLIQEYKALESKKKQIADEKEKKRKELNKNNEAIINEYCDSINKFLKDTGTDFKIVNTKTSFSGGKASLDYQIEIKSKKINLGKIDTPDNQISFKNTLSEGDKSALAFAFFIARLEKDATISDKIIVIDDPVSSLDCHRELQSVLKINSLSQNAKQTFIFTHRIEFAKSLFDRNYIQDIHTFRVKKIGSNSSLEIFNIEEKCINDYNNMYFMLFDYKESNIGVLRNIASSIRPILESNLRTRFPNSFGKEKKKWLGDFIEMIRNSDGTQDYSNLKNTVDLTEIEEINEYSKQFHHSNPGNKEQSLSNINETQLKAFVERTLKFCTK